MGLSAGKTTWPLIVTHLSSAETTEAVRSAATIARNRVRIIYGYSGRGRGFRRDRWVPVPLLFGEGVRSATALPATKDRQRLRLHAAVAGNDVGAVDGRVVVPVCEPAAGLLDDGLRRGHVPRVDSVFDH